MARKKNIVRQFSLSPSLSDEIDQNVPKKDQKKFFECAIRRELKKRKLMESVQRAFGPFRPSERPAERIAKIYAFVEETGVHLPSLLRGEENKKSKASKKGRKKSPRKRKKRS